MSAGKGDAAQAEQGPTVFVVDDDAAMRSSLRRLLKSKGLAVKTYSSAQGFLDNYEPSHAGCLVLEDLDGLVPGVEEDRDRGISDELPQRAQILDFQGVDQHRAIPGGRLHQLQDRAVGAFPLELHVQGHRIRFARIGDEGFELFGGGQEFHGFRSGCGAEGTY